MPRDSASDKNHYYIMSPAAAERRPTAVFLHGAGGDHTVWLAQFEALRSAGFGALALDFPGHGRAGSAAGGSIEALAGGVLALLRELRISKPILVGHSMGGAVAMAAALSCSALDGLVLIATGARLRVSTQFLEGIETRFSAAVVEICRTAFSERAPEEMIIRGIAKMSETPQGVLAADFRACNEFDVRDRLTRISLPTLILCGTEDRMTFPKYSEYLHERLPGSILRRVEGAGHMVMIEKPEEVSRALLDFLGSRAGSDL